MHDIVLCMFYQEMDGAGRRGHKLVPDLVLCFQNPVFGTLGNVNFCGGKLVLLMLGFRTVNLLVLVFS